MGNDLLFITLAILEFLSHSSRQDCLWPHLAATYQSPNYHHVLHVELLTLWRSPYFFGRIPR